MRCQEHLYRYGRTHVVSRHASKPRRLSQNHGQASLEGISCACVALEVEALQVQLAAVQMDRHLCPELGIVPEVGLEGLIHALRELPLDLDARLKLSALDECGYGRCGVWSLCAIRAGTSSLLRQF